MSADSDASFGRWLATVAPSELRRWSERLNEIGVSWNSFRHHQPEELVSDLVASGVPLMPSREIVTLASRELAQKDAPLALFWDLENMQIPSHISGREAATQLKSLVAPYGNLAMFRGYASIGLGLIPEEKRSDLHLSGVHLVDCPHAGRKEVADKMIIVDAMEFAFEHPAAATLCFVTGDVDYAYLLSVLGKKRPEWRTVIISRSTMESMLHVNCDIKLQWGNSEPRRQYVEQQRAGGRTSPSTDSPSTKAINPRSSHGSTEHLNQADKNLIRTAYRPRPVSAALSTVSIPC